MISHLHHINFVVRDLDSAVLKYSEIFEFDQFIYDELSTRNVKTARVKVGQTWLVLVQPVSEDGVPAQHLRDFGEGFFLLSLATDNTEHHLKLLDSVDNKTDSKLNELQRQGLGNWLVTDLPKDSTFGAQLQLTEEVNT